MKTYYLEHSKYRIWLVLLAMCISIFTVAYNTTAVMNALVAISDDLHLTSTALQWVVNSYLLACASFIIICGQLGDMFGRRNMLLVGCSFFIAASIIIALSHNPTLLIIGRALQGLSAAIITPSTLAVIKVGFPEKIQATAVGFWTATIGLGFAFGPIISGIFTSFLSWRDIFWINIPLMLIAMVLTRLFARKSRGPKTNVKLDIWGLILLVFGLVPLTLAIIEGNILGWTSMLTLFLLIGGITLLTAFWVIEHLVESPLIHFAHFRRRIFVAGSLGMGASIFALMGILYFYNTFLQNPQLLNYSPVDAGIALLPMSIAMFVVSLCASKITKRYGFRLPIVLALILISIACYFLHNFNLDSTYSDMWLPLLLFGIGVGISFSSSPALSLSTLPTARAGEGSGLINTINYYGGILCIAIGTIISIYAGSNRLDQLLSSADLAKIKMLNINQAVFQHLGDLKAIEATLSPQLKHILHQAIRHSIITSFSSVMLMCVAVTLAGAITVWFLAKDSINNSQ